MKKKNLKFVISRAAKNQWKFRIVSTKNGKCVLPSENYKRYAGMWKTIRSLIANGLDIPVFDKEGNPVTDPAQKEKEENV